MKVQTCLRLALLLYAGLTTRQAPAVDFSLFDRLTGTWDVTYEIYDKDGAMRPYHGQVFYSRILNGQALQEVWTSDIHNKEPQPYGTTITFLDAQRQRWTAVFVFPAKSYVGVVSGGESGGHIVLTGRDPDGTIQRWSIDKVKVDFFEWHFETSQDGGKNWRRVGVNLMQRHGA